jgi:hypothetical protein
LASVADLGQIHDYSLSLLLHLSAARIGLEI